LKEKFAAHKIPVPLHRAISIVIFNKDKTEMLITKRAKTKPTWPYFWTNAVCSHPYPEEAYQKAAERRLYEELGIKTPLKEVFNFTYSAKMNNKIWGEHELDHVFVGKYEGKIAPDPREAAGYEWVKIVDLKRDIKKNQKKYTPWFKIIAKGKGWQIVNRDTIADIMMTHNGASDF
jgi:isopentenyl-diphosphate delta-isomerase